MHDGMLKMVVFAGLLGGAFAISYFVFSPSEPKPPAKPNPENDDDTAPKRRGSTEGMRWIPGGKFMMGSSSESAHLEERPAHPVQVDGFWMDETEVTNAQFRKFVEATGYVTTAEKSPNPARKLAPGSLVFTPPDHAVPLKPRDAFYQWWKWVPGADWRHPEGPDSSIKGREDHPVVQVSWFDAEAYVKWAGKRLPTEAEWEFAARGGLKEKPYVWGDDRPTDKLIFSNIWQGPFPHRNLKTDGFDRTAPVRSFKPNGFGLYDVSGNVWEWCQDWYDPRLYAKRNKGVPTVNPAGPLRGTGAQEQRVNRGGSFLCSDQYCSRYRPSARHGTTPDTGMSHIGFRCAMSRDVPKKSSASK